MPKPARVMGLVKSAPFNESGIRPNSSAFLSSFVAQDEALPQAGAPNSTTLDQLDVRTRVRFLYDIDNVHGV